MSSKISGHSLLVVVGSVYANVIVQVDRLPSAGETLPAKGGIVVAGGKGATQAAAAARLACPTNLVAQVGTDGQAALIKEALLSAGVRVDHLNVVNVPTGQAVVMMQESSGSDSRSVIVVEGANVSWPRLDGGIGRLQPGAQKIIRCAAALLLQRQIPDTVNIEAAKIARNSNVPVILDTSGSETLAPEELLKCVTVLSTSQEDLSRIVGLSIITTNEAEVAARKCIAELGVKQVLVRLNDQGLLMVTPAEQVTAQPWLPVDSVFFDKSVADDIVTAAYAVAFIEGQPHADALKFAASAASLGTTSKAGLSSMPERRAVLQLLVQES